MPRVHEGDGKAFADGVAPAKAMISRDLSPMSPVKKRYLGD